MKSKPMTEIDRLSLAALIERVEEAITYELALSVADMQLLLLAITTLCTLQSKLAQDDITLHKLRKLLGMVRQSEQRRGAADPSHPGKDKKAQNNRGQRPKKKRHRPTTPPNVAHHKLTAYQRGEVCPGCQRGKLYKYAPSTLLRITGHARFEATHHVVEQLRCNGCQCLYKAPLPEAVLADGPAHQKYGYSARALMVIDKFYSGIPY